jgi:arsenate reductase
MPDGLLWPGLATRNHWPIEDPVSFQGDSEATMEKLREVRDELSRRLDHWLAEQDLVVRQGQASADSP